MPNEQVLSQEQRVLIAQHLELDLDPHVFRVDEQSITVCATTQRGIEISYALLEYGGCAGPGTTHQERVFVAADVFSQ